MTTDVQMQSLDDNAKSLAIPSIYLSGSSDQNDSICLHTPQDGDKIVQFDVDDKTPTNDQCYGRRASQRSWCSEPTNDRDMFNWLDTFDPSRALKRRFQNRRSSSSSSGYTQSASHVSTYGSKSRMDSFDRHSLPEVSSELDLRRVFSSHLDSTESSLSSKRQVKSCSNLAVLKDRRLPSDDKSDQSNDGSVSKKKTFEELYDTAYNTVPHTLESRSQKEERIQHWLRNLYVPPEVQEDVLMSASGNT